jgi:hypothetical protein
LTTLLGRTGLLSPVIARACLTSLEQLEREGRFEDVQGRIASGNSDDGLVDHGLYGVHLDAKLTLVERAQAEVDRQEERPSASRMRRRKAWAWLLKTFNVLLESIGAAVPGVGVVTELKHTAEAGLDEDGTFRERLARRLPFLR